ncbi:MAG: glucosamine-6-phosphate deaminase [Verrucomicrobiota bacterium]
MKVVVSENRKTSGYEAAVHGATLIRRAISNRGYANIIVATGASQFEMLEALIQMPDIDWEKVTGFHLDEYVGLSIRHPASFRGYLWERFHKKLPVPLKAFHYISGENDPLEECARLGALIQDYPIDVCFAGFGENAHLAFNDPPADFHTEKPYLVLDLDEACRRQQQGEGWFPTLDDVPKSAISMSVRQILKSKSIVITAPDERKAKAVRDSIEGPITNQVPGSVLQSHSDTVVFLDPPAASLLKKS